MRAERLAAAALLLAAIAPHFLLHKTDLVYDDKAVIEFHSFVLAKDFGKIWSTPYWGGIERVYQRENLERPIFLSLAAAAREHVDFLRFLVLLTHLGVGAMVFAYLKSRQSARQAQALPWLGAGVFLLHPAVVETTAQIVGLLETVPTLLGALSLRLLAARPGAALALAAIAPGWKETGYVWLAAVTGLLAWRGKRLHAALGAAAIAAWLIHRYWVFGALFSSEVLPYDLLNPLVSMSPWDAFWTRFSLVGEYLKLFVLPIGLSSDYSRGTLPLPGYPIQVFVLLALAFLAVVARVAWEKARRKRFREPPEPFDAFPWIAMLTLAPTLHIAVPAMLIFAERFGYAFWAGLTALSFEALQRAIPTFRDLRFRKAATGAICLALAGLYARTLSRHADWTTSQNLFQADSAAFPQNAKLHFNLAFTLGGARQWERARDEFQAAISLAPDFPEAHFRLGLVYLELGDKSQARAHFGAATQLGYPVPDNLKSI